MDGGNDVGPAAHLNLAYVEPQNSDAAARGEINARFAGETVNVEQLEAELTRSQSKHSVGGSVAPVFSMLASDEGERVKAMQGWLERELSAERMMISRMLEQRHESLVDQMARFQAQNVSGMRMTSFDSQRLSSFDSTPNKAAAASGLGGPIPEGEEQEAPGEQPAAAKTTGAEDEKPMDTSAKGNIPGRSMSMKTREQASELAQDMRCSRSWLRDLVTSAVFEITFGVLIIVNTVVMAAQRQYQGMVSANLLELQYAGVPSRPAEEIWPGASGAFEVIEIIFGVLFTLEVIIKVVAMGREFVTETAWNWFDTVVVACWLVDTMQVFDLGIDPMMLRLARLARLLRLLRILRWVQIFDPLHLMVKAISASYAVLLWALVMLILIISVIAMIVSQLLDPYIQDQSLVPKNRIDVFLQWGSFTRAVETMFEITLANWGPPCRLLMNNVDEGWAIFILTYKLTVGLAVVQVILSVFIQQTFKVASRDEEVMIKEKNAASDALMKNLDRLFEVLDKSGDGSISREEFFSVLEDKRVKTWFAALEVDASEVSQVFDMLDDGDGEIIREEFVRGIKAIKGPAKSSDMLVLLRDMRRNGRAIGTVVNRLNTIEGILSHGWHPHEGRKHSHESESMFDMIGI